MVPCPRVPCRATHRPQYMQKRYHTQPPWMRQDNRCAGAQSPCGSIAMRQGYYGETLRRQKH
jgi:hypothetical protein